MKGVYEIRNTVNGECYIGKADSFEARWKLHRDTLRERRHHSHLLQAAWDAYGEDAFEFSVLEVVADPMERAAREIELILERKPAYNIAGTGRDSAERLARLIAKRATTAAPPPPIPPEELPEGSEFDWLRAERKPWLHVPELAKRLGVSSFIVRSRCESGAFYGARFYRSGAGWRIPRSGVIAFLKSQKGSET